MPGTSAGAPLQVPGAVGHSPPQAQRSCPLWCFSPPFPPGVVTIIVRPFPLECLALAAKT